MSKISMSTPHMGDSERALLLDAFDSNWVASLGPHVEAFELELAARLGLDHCAVLSSGTAAIHLALLLLDVQPGDEVFTSTLTFAATANAITYSGARPVFIDSERQTWNMDPQLLAQALEAADKAARLPKAVVIVDIYGQCADYRALLPICQKYGVPVIEDAAEALGASFMGQAAGSFGDFGVLSFNGNKIITSAGGGALLSNNQQHIERARFLATQARDPVPHYQHSTIGYNYRLSNLLAAVGRGQLQVLDQRVAQRRAHKAAYRQALGGLPGLDFMPDDPRGRANNWLSVITVDAQKFGASREDIRLALAAQEIESRPVWKPMHLQPVFKDARRVGGAVAEDLFARGLCLPSGSNMSAEDRQRVIAAIGALHLAKK